MLKSQDSERNARHSLINERTTDDNLNRDEHDADGDNKGQIIILNDTKSYQSQMVCNVDADNLQYEDPMVSELKQTEV